MILPGCIDLTGYGASRLRKKRRSSELRVPHRFDVSWLPGCPSDPLLAPPWFFTQDPEGIATVTLQGPYAAKLPIIEQWRHEGIPRDRKDNAFCAYTFGVASDGRVGQYLPLDARGAHTGGRLGGVAVNDASVGIAWLGEFRSPLEMTKRERQRVPPHPPTPESVDALRGLLAKLDDILGPGEVLTHSEVNERSGYGVEDGRSAKRCPGAQAMGPLGQVRSWLELRRINMAEKARW